MPELSKDELTEVIKNAVQAAHVTDGSHSDDHEFIRLIKDERKRRREMWSKIKTNVIGAIILSIIGGISTIFYKVGIWYLTHAADKH